MPDISMCATYTCPLFKTCYRAQAEENPFMQSYGSFLPTTNKEGVTTCNHYWKVNEKQ